ncbi:MAG: MBL fold metallo-hydrolase [Verrucomicrobiales bacterium]|nr:MBL fold metallo-hydrolase [Verrucomicrobiales bacterium]
MKRFGLVGVLPLTLSVAILEAEPVPNTDRIGTPKGDITVYVINHATFALGWSNLTIYVDPVGPQERFGALPRPDLVLITDTHSDHFSPDTLKFVLTDQTRLVVPPAVAAQLAEPLRERTTVMTNGQVETVLNIKIEAVPAYNITPARLRYHSKGRGNGYVLTLGGTRVYISGDTEDIPEMRSLKDIDIAFVCMNLPYTMTVEQAADAVRAFRPKIVYPYHYRGSDLQKFKTLVGEDPSIEVRLRDWYRQ